MILYFMYNMLSHLFFSTMFHIQVFLHDDFQSINKRTQNSNEKQNHFHGELQIATNIKLFSFRFLKYYLTQKL